MYFYINANSTVTTTNVVSYYEVESSDMTIHVGPNTTNVGDRLIFFC